jgi:hypothetical protein
MAELASRQSHEKSLKHPIGMDNAIWRFGALKIDIPSQYLLMEAYDRGKKIGGGVLLHPLLNETKLRPRFLLYNADGIAVEQEHSV